MEATDRGTADQGRGVETRWIDEKTFQVLVDGCTINVRPGRSVYLNHAEKIVDEVEIIRDPDSKFVLTEKVARGDNTDSSVLVLIARKENP